MNKNEAPQIDVPDDQGFGPICLFDSIEYFSYTRNKEALSFFLNSVDITDDIKRTRLGSRLRVFDVQMTFKVLTEQIEDASEKDWEHAITKLIRIRENLLRKDAGHVIYPRFRTKAPFAASIKLSMYENMENETLDQKDINTGLSKSYYFCDQTEDGPFRSISIHCRAMQALGFLRHRLRSNRAAKGEFSPSRYMEIAAKVDNPCVEQFLLRALVISDGVHRYNSDDEIEKILSSPDFSVSVFQEAIRNYLHEIEIAALGRPVLREINYIPIAIDQNNTIERNDRISSPYDSGVVIQSKNANRSSDGERKLDYVSEQDDNCSNSSDKFQELELAENDKYLDQTNENNRQYENESTVHNPKALEETLDQVDIMNLKMEIVEMEISEPMTLDVAEGITKIEH
eukprot:CAMPEP_0113316740 /NCGR_PEP_ID=MMETSP0010_2-20120614/11908_1 /TAXON_ID=216773 ORGANISM="Corethron hystrix, Strain 308" /NCGR_SAMPLE_ID=MMETSP0010_2 /ASSEMBLY_ACC=CAM_ASM_000155 /LENGTH=399 /DNA_ID=CAMNT_0000173543 /DNA_START=208 /DNA_END=1408 /DNA_ORIENTATION=+ /assembly_acc=CAM_ASM_000155